MGLTMGQRKAVTKVIATRYKRASKADKSKIPLVVTGTVNQVALIGGLALHGQPVGRTADRRTPRG